MRIVSVFCTLALVLFMSIGSFAQTPAKESFVYPVPKFDNIGKAENGFGGPWLVDTSAHGADQKALIGNGIFSYGALDYAMSDTGNAMQITLSNAWSDAQRYKRALAAPWPNTAGKTYWVSYLLDVKTEVQGNTYFFLKLYNANPLLSGSGEIIAIGKSGGQSSPVFSCGSGWTGDAPDASSSAINAGPVWLVARFNMTGNADPCRTFMWVSPDPTTEPDTTTAVVKRFTGMKDGFNAIAIESGGDVAAGKNIQLVFDKISLATSYKDLSKVTGVKAAGINQPSDFRLSQNYPNPFNPSTVINYSLKTAGNVRLTVYNILGKEVAELVNGPVSAGMHEVTFNASGLASGMYFYQLRSGSLVQTMKMILMK